MIDGVLVCRREVCYNLNNRDVVNVKKWFTFFVVSILMLPLSTKAMVKEVASYQEQIQISKEKVITVRESYQLTAGSIDSNLIRVLPLQKSYTIGGTELLLQRSIEQINSSRDFVQETLTDGISLTVPLNPIDQTVNLSYSYPIKSGMILIPLLDGSIDAPLLQSEFRIQLPKAVSETNISLLAPEDLAANLLVEDTLLRVQIVGEIPAQTTLFLQLELSEEYFISLLPPPVIEEKTATPFPYWVLLFPILGLLVALICWFKYGKGNALYSEELVYPPKNLDSVEIGFLYKGYIDQEDIISLILYLATQGYIQVVENPDGESELENSIEIIKLKEYTGDNAAQHTIFEALFESGDQVKIKDLSGTLGDDSLHIIQTINNDYNRSILYQKEIPIIKIVLLILFAIAFPLSLMFGVHQVLQHYVFDFLVLLLATLGGYLLFFPVLSRVQRYLLGIPFVGIGLVLSCLGYWGEWTSFALTICSSLLSLGIVVIFGKLPLRTVYGNQMLGLIYSFRQTLLKMVPKRIEEESKTTKEYFFSMIPYAISLGILEQWLSNDQITQAPSWYHTYRDFEMKNFHVFIKNLEYQFSVALKLQDEPTAQIPATGIGTILSKNNGIKATEDDINSSLEESGNSDPM